MLYEEAKLFVCPNQSVPSLYSSRKPQITVVAILAPPISVALRKSC